MRLCSQQTQRPLCFGVFLSKSQNGWRVMNTPLLGFFSWFLFFCFTSPWAETRSDTWSNPVNISKSPRRLYLHLGSVLQGDREEKGRRIVESLSCSVITGAPPTPRLLWRRLPQGSASADSSSSIWEEHENQTRNSGCVSHCTSCTCSRAPKQKLDWVLPLSLRKVCTCRPVQGTPLFSSGDSPVVWNWSWCRTCLHTADLHHSVCKRLQLLIYKLFVPIKAPPKRTFCLLHGTMVTECSLGTVYLVVESCHRLHELQ